MSASVSYDSSVIYLYWFAIKMRWGQWNEIAVDETVQHDLVWQGISSSNGRLE